jgi:hypothetical protein
LLRSQADYWMSQAMLAGSKILSATARQMADVALQLESFRSLRPEIDMQIGPAWGG